MPTNATPTHDHSDAALQRYVRASNSHRALQAARGRIDATRHPANRVAALIHAEAALKLAAVELDAARDAYLYYPINPAAINETA
jgi:hypothetical protein